MLDNVLFCTRSEWLTYTLGGDWAFRGDGGLEFALLGVGDRVDVGKSAHFGKIWVVFSKFVQIVS